MQDQVRFIILQTDDNVRYILESGNIRQTRDGNTQSFAMSKNSADKLLNDIVRLVSDDPTPDSEPYRNTIVLNDQRKIRVPREELTALIETALAKVMKLQQIAKVIWNGDAQAAAEISPEEPYSIELEIDSEPQSGSITMCNAEGEDTAMLSDRHTLKFLEQICALTESEQPSEPLSAPFRSEVILRDGTVIPLPWKALKAEITAFWTHSVIFTKTVTEMPLMGAVACFTDPTGNLLPPNGIMPARMGMGMLPQMPAPAPYCGTAALPPQALPWDCPNCGTKSLSSKFCPECGTKQPE